MLACRAHGHVLPLEIEFLGTAPFAQEEQPGAVDGPVTEVAGAGEVEGPGGERVGEVVAYGGCASSVHVQRHEMDHGSEWGDWKLGRTVK